MKLLLKYFPGLTPLQQEQFGRMYDLYRGWNDKINVVSRKDIDQLYLHHVLHSLAIAQVVSFRPGTRVLDVGTGGGFPGIPLAVLFPEAQFTLVDSIGKKIRVVEDVATQLGLKNVQAIHGRAEEVRGDFDFMVSRAVTEMSAFLTWVWDKIVPGGTNDLPNGILYLKGGDLAEELNATQKDYMVYNISRFFDEDFFDTKRVVYIAKK